MTTVLITGATGNVGREVVRAASASGLMVRAGVRDPSKGEAACAPNVTRVRFDFCDPETFASSDGAETVFLMRPPAISDVSTTLLPFVDEARRRGVKHIVFLSVAGADTNKLVPHHAVEAYLKRGTGWTILRPGFFAQNFGDAYRQDIVEDDRVYVPAGRGRVAFIDVRDIADVATSIFASSAEHNRRAYTLTGAEAIDFESAVRLLSEVIGRRVRYDSASILGYALHLHRRRMKWAQVAVQTVLHVGLRFGQAAKVDPTLARLLSAAPRTLIDYFRDACATWQTSGRPDGN